MKFIYGEEMQDEKKPTNRRKFRKEGSSSTKFDPQVIAEETPKKNQTGKFCLFHFQTNFFVLERERIFIKSEAREVE